MDTWITWGPTERLVGFCEDGRVSEGDHCEHLHEGDQAFGYLAKHDKWGAEHHLMCQTCYELYTQGRESDLNEHLAHAERNEAERQEHESTREPLRLAHDDTSFRIMKDMRKPKIV
jgi:hypothetical protein